MCEILPYVEQNNLAGQMYTNPWYVGFFNNYNKPVKAYLCPSDPRGLTAIAAGNGALTCYLGVTGSDNDVNVQVNGPTNGVFDVSSAGVRLTDVTDGASNTLMVGERPPTTNLQEGWWGASDYDTLLSTRQLYGDLFGAPGCVSPGLYGPGRTGGPCNGDGNHFWSYHTNGANWVFADGSVHYLSYSASALTIPLGVAQRRRSRGRRRVLIPVLLLPSPLLRTTHGLLTLAEPPAFVARRVVPAAVRVGRRLRLRQSGSQRRRPLQRQAAALRDHSVPRHGRRPLRRPDRAGRDVHGAPAHREGQGHRPLRR